MDLDLFTAVNGSVRRLAHTHRFSSLPVQRPENVAEHSFFVATYALLVARDLENRGVGPIDLGEVAIKALWHDFPEALTGDLPRHLKYHDERVLAQLKRVEGELTEGFAQAEFGQVAGDYASRVWRDAKSDGSLEASIVSFSDFVAALAYIREEVAMGNVRIAQLAEGNHRVLRDRYVDHTLFQRYYWQLFPNGGWRDIYRELPESWQRISAD